MPRLPIDYSNTIIYKLVCNDVEIKELYVGHTTDFKARKNKHKHSCNTETNKSYNIYVYQFIRENGGWTNWTMVLIEEIKCNNKLEACKVERKYIEELQASLNKIIPTRTKEEYNALHKEELNQYQKEYNELHKEEINKYKKEYNALHKEDINQKNKEYNELHKEELNQKKKKYNELHKEEINQYQKEYYELHKEEINQKQRDKRLQKKLQMV
jgi:hypothetical protein